MSGRISQPVGQVRFTNVAVVRMKKAGKRFEVAAYKNKVMNWRSRVETDINEVLQSDSVYTNVSKGVVANRKDLMEAFGTDDMLKVAMLILDKGDVEVSDKERAALTESLFHDIASIICQKCVNPATKLPYTLSMIERALRDIHFSVVLGKTAKQQALKAVALLKEHMDIERASMRVRVGVPTSGVVDLKDFLASLHVDITADMPAPGRHMFDVTLDPGHYRALEERVTELGRGAGTFELLSLGATSGEDDATSGRGSGGAAAAGAGGDDSDAEGEVPGTAASASTATRAAAAATAAEAERTAAAARGTGMMVRRVVQPGVRLRCGACGVEFADADERKVHFSSDVHRYNLAAKVRGVAPVTQEEFDAIPPKVRDAFIASAE